MSFAAANYSINLSPMQNISSGPITTPQTLMTEQERAFSGQLAFIAAPMTLTTLYHYWVMSWSQLLCKSMHSMRMQTFSECDIG